MNNIGKEKKVFTLVFNEKYHLIDSLGIKYKIISEPKKVDEGYSYEIEEIK